MLNFKNTNIAFITSFLILIILRINSTFSLLYFALPITFYLVILFFGVKNICMNFFLKSYCSLEDKSKVHFTFDDGPDINITPKILEILKKYNQKATFFCIGHKIEKHPKIIQQIISEGHKIGNHSYTHSNFFDLYKTSKVIHEIEKTNKLIKKITGEKCPIFRPPFGLTNPNIAKAVKKLNMEVIAWNIRSYDTIKDKETVLKRINKTKKGDIILFHDTKEQTVEILDEFLRLVIDADKD